MKMRKCILVVTAGILVITLAGRALAIWAERRPTENDTLNYQMSERIFADQMFLSAVDNNYIDAQFKFVDGSTEDAIKLYSDYATVWTQEMDDTIAALNGLLDKTDFDLLMSAQEGWQGYLENSVKFNRALYYIGSKYNTANSNTYRDVTVEKARMVRNRTIDLWLYLYTLTESTDFIVEGR